MSLLPRHGHAASRPRARPTCRAPRGRPWRAALQDALARAKKRKVHDCARQGAVLFGPLIGDEPLVAKASCCVFSANGQYMGDNDAIRGPFDGILARSNVEAELASCLVEDSGSAGIAALEDSTVVLVGSTLRGNRRGASSAKGGGQLVVQQDPAGIC
ncbi:unnamed protein product [Prorocentrum cordatum]|uniref:Uncharacterized protein n=1 Tax=Prorocentrum cordatum TaxID=2364126 RepID=A0ABN9UVI5_9DINO|nr:unnamed protein product [Polarella glacialis]